MLIVKASTNSTFLKAHKDLVKKRLIHKYIFVSEEKPLLYQLSYLNQVILVVVKMYFIFNPTNLFQGL